MNRLVPLALALAVSAQATAQEPFVLTVDTGQAEYDYGETILVRIRVTNTGTEPATIWGSSTCRAMFTLDGYNVLDHTICTLDETPVTYPPGATRQWVWEVEPARLGLPEWEGDTHTVTGYHARLPGLTDAVTITAPQYLGGRVEVGFPTDTPPEVIQPVRDSLNAVVLDHLVYGDITYEKWQIEGLPLLDAVALYEDDSRFVYFEGDRLFLSPPGVFVTASEPPAEPEAAHVHVTPNPFPGALRVAVTPPQTEAVRVAVFDLRGRRLAVLHDGPLAGDVPHEIAWHPARLPAGVYVVHVEGATFQHTQRVTHQR